MSILILCNTRDAIGMAQPTSIVITSAFLRGYLQSSRYPCNDLPSVCCDTGRSPDCGTQVRTGGDCGDRRLLYMEDGDSCLRVRLAGRMDNGMCHSRSIAEPPPLRKLNWTDDATPAVRNGPQSLAMVLLYENLVQLRRDHRDDCCVGPVAVAMVHRRSNRPQSHKQSR